MNTAEALAVLDDLPTLPDNISLPAASLWAVGTILRTAISRGWSLDDVRFVMLSMLLDASADDASEAELRGDFERALMQLKTWRRAIQ